MSRGKTSTLGQQHRPPNGGSTCEREGAVCHEARARAAHAHVRPHGRCQVRRAVWEGARYSPGSKRAVLASPVRGPVSFQLPVIPSSFNRQRVTGQPHLHGLCWAVQETDVTP